MNDKKVVDMYNHPEKYGFKKEEYGTVKNTIKSLYPDQTFAINDNDMRENCYLLEDIGKTVFLTQAEAEQKLKEMESGEDD